MEEILAPKRQLGPAELSAFRRDGVLVVPSVISSDEVAACRAELHGVLLARYGVDVNNLSATAANLGRASSTNGAGGILDIFYEPFQLRLTESPKIVSILCDLWREMRDTYTEEQQAGMDPERALAAVDRVCFRVNDAISSSASGISFGGKKRQTLQRHLAPHLDCCPHPHQSNSNSQTVKWRPIQCFVALTDCLEENSGGFEACFGHHLSFSSWAASRAPSASTGLPAPCVGEFTPIRPTEDADIISRMQHVPCRAGDLVLWDNRIPHANARSNAGCTREVVYLKLLPHCPINAAYVASQRSSFLARSPPTDFWIAGAGAAGKDQNKDEDDGAPSAHLLSLPLLGRSLFGLDDR